MLGVALSVFFQVGLRGHTASLFADDPCQIGAQVSLQRCIGHTADLLQVQRLGGVHAAVWSPARIAESTRVAFVVPIYGRNRARARQWLYRQRIEANPWNCVRPLRKIGMNNILAPVPQENIRKP
jgi:hypothetical protein